MDTNGLTPLLEVWGLFPEHGPGTEPLFRGSGAKPPRSSKLFATQVADFCLRLRFFGGYKTAWAIFPLQMPILNNAI